MVNLLCTFGFVALLAGAKPIPMTPAATGSPRVTVPSAGTSRYAIVDMIRVRNEWSEFRDAMTRARNKEHVFETSLAPRQAEIFKLNRDIGTSTDNSKKQVLERKKTQLLERLRSDFTKIKEDLAKQEDAVYQSYNQRIAIALKSVCSKKRIDVVFHKALVAYPEMDDLTAAVLDELTSTKSR